MQMSDVIRAMELSAIAYRNIQPVFSYDSLTVIDDRKTDVQCYLRKRDGCLNITFRGSTSGEDWKTNLTFCKKVIPYGNTASKIRVHTGFLEAYKSPNVRNVIHKKMTCDVNQVKISGHSQGAALAILCAVDLEYNYPERDYEVILFGAPRVGNRAFQKSYDKRVFKTLRIENGNDIVTKIPFAIMGYRHVGVGIHIGRPRIPGLFSFKSHYPQAYYKNLLKLLCG
jgi:triacylglycerol lipase